LKQALTAAKASVNGKTTNYCKQYKLSLVQLVEMLLVGSGRHVWWKLLTTAGFTTTVSCCLTSQGRR